MTPQETDRLIKNYSNARRSWECWCYLNNIDVIENNNEIKKRTDRNELLYHARYVFSKDMHIELYKLLKENKNTRDNLFRYLKESSAKSSDDQILKFRKFSTQITEIINVRDKFYAHLDEDYEDFLTTFKIDDYYNIFELIEESIIILGMKKELMEALALIPSRNDFKIN